MPPDLVTLLSQAGSVGLVAAVFFVLHNTARKEYVTREERMMKSIEELSKQAVSALAENNRVLASLERLLDDRLPGAGGSA